MGLFAVRRGLFGKVLLAVVLTGIIGFYLLERYWLAEKVEQASPERLHEFEHAAQEKLHELGHELQERIHFKHGAPRAKEEAAPAPQVEKSGSAEAE